METVDYPTEVVQSWTAERDRLREENERLRGAVGETEGLLRRIRDLELAQTIRAQAIRQLQKQRYDLLAACEAALRYDAAIQRHAAKGQSWVDGDDLDMLHEDWISKSRDAVGKADQRQGPGRMAEEQAYWNGEPALARKVRAVVEDAPQFSLYWAKELGLIGQEVDAVEVTFEGHVFYLDDRTGAGWLKVTTGKGSPQVAHSHLEVSEVKPR